MNTAGMGLQIADDTLTTVYCPPSPSLKVGRCLITNILADTGNIKTKNVGHHQGASDAVGFFVKVRLAYQGFHKDTGA